MTKTLQVFSITLAIMSSLSLHGATLVFQSQPQPPHQFSSIGSEIGIGGSFGPQAIRPLSGSTIDMQLDLHRHDLTVVFRRTTIDINETIDLSSEFDVNTFGGTQTITISGTIGFDTTLNFLDDRVLSTMPWQMQDDQFEVIGFHDFELGRSDQTLITGSYSFSGPTQNAEGTFSFSPRWRRTRTPIIDGRDFPNSVTLNGAPVWNTAADGNIFNGQIDGVDISVGFTHADFYVPDNNLFVPEPSTYAFASGLVLIAFILFRRRRMQ